jgi:hypothetical protein
MPTVKDKPFEVTTYIKTIFSSISGLAIILATVASISTLFHRVEELETKMMQEIANNDQVYATVIRLEERSKHMNEKIDRLLENQK